MESSTSYTELVALGTTVINPRNTNPIRRAPSYSDSFLVLQAKATVFEPIDLELVSTVPALPTNIAHERCLWAEKSLSILFHLFLISVFESLFFRLFITKSEDKGILTTVQNLVTGVTGSCQTWTLNQTLITNDLLALFVNSTQVQKAAMQAFQNRSHYNAAIFTRSWIYVGALGSAVVLLFSVLRCFKKIQTFHLRPILLENLGLVMALGLYEYMFFSTVIYDYDSISVSEIEGNIVQMLHNQCGLFLE